MMKVDIISKESIKPSSPTPPHLKTFKLSLLDQLILKPFNPPILFYPNHNHNNNNLQGLEKSLALKQSLSKALTQFYPLAGTIKDDLSVDCNDVGAYYVVALVNRRLNEFLSHPELEFTHKFLPCEPSFFGSSIGNRITNVQINVFECGGIAIGLCMSHKILDGAALDTFLKRWASISCGSRSTQLAYPISNSNLSAPSSLFPANDSLLMDSSMPLLGSVIKQGKCITKRFVFDSTAIATLKAEAITNNVKQPTRVEVVSGLIWKCAMAASKETCGSQKPSLVNQAVDIRKRLATATFKDSIGNLVFTASAGCKADYETITLHDMVGKLRQSVSNINSELLEKLQGDRGYAVLEESLKEIGEFANEGVMDYYLFTSWCRMGFYETDFGWGTPIWVSGIVGHGSSVFLNLVTLVDTKCGDGIEAWVNLEEEEMKILQCNRELLAFASVDPSPLQTGEAAASSNSPNY